MRRKLVFGGIVAVMVVTGAIAFACTNLATLNLSSAAGKAGDTVTVTGSSFAVISPKDAAAGKTSTPVVLHWNGADGPVLGQAVPDLAGNISTPIAIPQAAPGYYVIVAKQVDEKGIDKYGTPARAAFQILGPNGQSVVQQPGAEGVTPLASEPISTGMIALTALLGVLGLGLFGAGMGAFVRQARRREVPAATPVRKS
jgi:hypothetical protein